MASIIINIQSYINLITNSSTETFVQATQKTVDTVKEIIDLLIQSQVGFQNIHNTADDLFTIKLRSSQWQDLYDEYKDDPEELEDLGTEEEYIAKGGDGENCPFNYLEILPKVEKDHFTDRIAYLFRNLQDTYESDVYMC